MTKTICNVVSEWMLLYWQIGKVIYAEEQVYKYVVPLGFRDAMNFKIPLRRRGVRRTGWVLITRWQTQSDGVDYAPKTAPRFFAFPVGESGWS